MARAKQQPPISQNQPAGKEETAGWAAAFWDEKASDEENQEHRKRVQELMDLLVVGCLVVRTAALIPNPPKKVSERRVYTQSAISHILLVRFSPFDGRRDATG